MRKKAINALIEMGATANTVGFRYIVDAICVMVEKNDYVYGKTIALYETIAQRNQATAAGVERGIRNAFTNILKAGNIVAVDKYLSRENTTTGNLLSVFFLRLTLEE